MVMDPPPGRGTFLEFVAEPFIADPLVEELDPELSLLPIEACAALPCTTLVATVRDITPVET